MNGPTLTTERLILRPFVAEDFAPFVEMMAHERTGFIGGPMTPPVAWRAFAAIAGAWSIEGISMFSVIERDTGRWMGRVGPWRPLGWPGNEVGWGLIEAAEGRGYATEAATASMDWAFDHLGWDDIIHTIGPTNLPSQAVARRLGAENRGPGRLPAPLDGWDVEVWGQTKAAWRARRRS